MRKVLAGILIGAALSGSVAVAATSGGKFDKRDAITCAASLQEDDRYMNFKRLDDGRARIVIFCS